MTGKLKQLLDFINTKNDKNGLFKCFDSGSPTDILKSFLKLFPQTGYTEPWYEIITIPAENFTANIKPKLSNLRLLFVFIQSRDFDLKVLKEVFSLKLTDNKLSLRGIIFRNHHASITLVRVESKYILYKLSKSQEYDSWAEVLISISELSLVPECILYSKTDHKLSESGNRTIEFSEIESLFFNEYIEEKNSPHAKNLPAILENFKEEDDEKIQSNLSNWKFIGNGNQIDKRAPIKAQEFGIGNGSDRKITETDSSKSLKKNNPNLDYNYPGTQKINETGNRPVSTQVNDPRNNSNMFNTGSAQLNDPKSNSNMYKTVSPQVDNPKSNSNMYKTVPSQLEENKKTSTGEESKRTEQITWKCLVCSKFVPWSQIVCNCGFKNKNLEAEIVRSSNLNKCANCNQPSIKTICQDCTRKDYWNCEHCTLINKGGHICDACAKTNSSRNKRSSSYYPNIR